MEAEPTKCSVTIWEEFIAKTKVQISNAKCKMNARKKLKYYSHLTFQIDLKFEL